jgi:SSS family solute:Na+ symporter
VLLVVGGLVTVYIGLNLVSEQNGVFQGLQIMYQQIPEKFDLILSPDNVHYQAMPGISVLIGGMWLINIVYWGLNQYIIQRALAAKNLQEAQKGMLFAGCLKLLIPFIIVFPGIIAAYLVPDLPVADQAYPEMMKLLPDGLKGLVFAALLAAVVSTIASMMNSIATIFTMDLYASWRKKEIESGVINASKLVNIGRVASLISVILACLLAKPLLSSMDQAFQYMQEAITFFSPGIATIFLFGMFWPKATEKAAIWAMICSVLVSTLLSLVWPQLPFIDRVVLVFASCSVVIVLKSIAKPVVNMQPSTISYPSFSTSAIYNMGAVVLTLALSTIYAFLW